MICQTLCLMQQEFSRLVGTGELNVHSKCIRIESKNTDANIVRSVLAKNRVFTVFYKSCN